MKFYRRHWYDVGCILFLALAFSVGYWGQKVSHIQAILIYSFMALLVHQYEESVAPAVFLESSTSLCWVRGRCPNGILRTRIKY